MTSKSFQHRFLGDSRGSSAIEYAILIGIVAGGALLTVDSLGTGTDESISQVASALGSARGKAMTERSAAPPEPDADSAPGQRRHLSPVTREGIAGGLCVSAAALAAILARAKRKAAKAPPVDSAEAKEVSQTLPTHLFEKRQRMLNSIGAALEDQVSGALFVRHLMSEHVAETTPLESVDEVRRRMREKHIRHMLVADSHRRLVGLISDRDILARQGDRVRDIMTRKPLSVSPDLPIVTALTMLVNKSISCLPVTRDEKIVGILTTTDVLLALQSTVMLLEKSAAHSGNSLVER